MWLKTDFVRFAIHLLPTMLRGEVLMALVYSLILPFRSMYDRFSSHRKTTFSRLNTTANVQYIEKALCSAFFLTDSQIYIENSPGHSGIFLHFHNENQSAVYLSKTGDRSIFLKKPDEVSYEDNFIVYVPSFLCTSLNANIDKYNGQHLQTIRLILDRYKPAGRMYRIELYDYE